MKAGIGVSEGTGSSSSPARALQCVPKENVSFSTYLSKLWWGHNEGLRGICQRVKALQSVLKAGRDCEIKPRRAEGALEAVGGLGQHIAFRSIIAAAASLGLGSFFSWHCLLPGVHVERYIEVESKPQIGKDTRPTAPNKAEHALPPIPTTRRLIEP